MLTARFRMKGIAIFATATLALAMTATPTLASGGFYVPAPDKGAVKQIKDLVKQGDSSDLNDAALLTAMVSEGHAVWFTGGTPGNVLGQVRQTMMLAKVQNTVPVLVAYNIPGRDCSQYSAGGALDAASYAAWIDGFAKGIGTGEAIVILEPDGLGLLPSGCSPPSTVFTNADRYAELNAAVDRLELQPQVSVYLDGTHSNWLGVGDISQRLVNAGVERAQGFFLNVSNYELTSNLARYGSWISKCLWFGSSTSGSWGKGHYDYCASQYYSGAAPNDGQPGNSVSPSDPSTWHWTDLWYANNVENQTWVPYPGDAGLTHFVIDTSRNGLGPWTPPAGKYSSGDPQTWCNPPGRGVGDRPTANTGVPLIDAYLWVKVPGESDGSCTRSTGGTIDPEWGIVDPAAGQWFPHMALQLAQLADPPLH